MIADRDHAATLADAIAGSDATVALIGAGASAASGVPTYRGAGGSWTRYDPARYASIEVFRGDPSYYWSFFKDERYPVLRRAQPNAAHRALAALERSGKLRTVVTQNIDGLHQAAGSRQVLELHGNSRRFLCEHCQASLDYQTVYDLVANAIPPRCARCGEPRLRPDVVMFGERLDPQVLAAALQAMDDARLALVVGSSLVVQPAASLPLRTLARGGRLAVINIDPTPLDELAFLVVREPADAVLARVLARLGIEA